jgi:ribosomal protein S12 methylthiotransferase accessory factor
MAEFGVSRVGELTHLDKIGLPVYSAVRALSKTISIHSGKGLEPFQARAGAILEAMEFEVAEHPIGEFRVAAPFQIPEEARLDLADCFLTRSSVMNELTPVAWEELVNIQNGEPKLVPSDLVWMTNRISDQQLMYFQMGSNGLASGGSVEDAVLAGLYEVLERDAWTLNQFLLDNCGLQPPRTPLLDLPPRLEAAVQKIELAEAKLHLFDITNDYQVPTFGAVLLDLSGHCAGTFSGYGAHINAEIAAIRAITEAAQARCCYISGARDDLFRRQFLLMKRMDQHKLDQMFNELPAGSPLSEYRKLSFPTVRAELRYLLKLIRRFGVSQVFVKEMGSFLDGTVHIVRVISPQCEPFRFDHWSPTLRCLSYAQRKVKSLSEKVTVNQEEGEEWKEA